MCLVSATMFRALASRARAMNGVKDASRHSSRLQGAGLAILVLEPVGEAGRRASVTESARGTSINFSSSMMPVESVSRMRWNLAAVRGTHAVSTSPESAEPRTRM